MTIVNDVVTFQAGDFAGLSSFAVSAIISKHGSTAALLAALSSQVTSIVKLAKASYVQTNAQANTDLNILIQKFAAADAPLLAAAADEIAALKTALTP